MFSYEEYDDEEFSVSPHHKGRGYYFLPSSRDLNTPKKVKSRSDSDVQPLKLLIKEQELQREKSLKTKAQFQSEVAELKAELAKQRLESIKRGSYGTVDRLAIKLGINPRQKRTEKSKISRKLDKNSIYPEEYSEDSIYAQ